MRTTQSGRIEDRAAGRCSAVDAGRVRHRTCGRLRLTIECADNSFELAVGGVTDRLEEEARSFRVIWQDVESRTLVHVGWLEYTGSGFEFSYTDEARRHERLPVPAPRSLDEVYRSANLFPCFAVRLIGAADPELRGSVGRALDSQVKAPRQLSSWRSSRFAARHDSGSARAVRGTRRNPSSGRFWSLGSDTPMTLPTARRATSSHRLSPDARLELVPEPTNPHNPRAIQIVSRRTQLGWLPNYCRRGARLPRDRTAR